MNEERLQDAIGRIGDDLIENAKKPYSNKKRLKKRAMTTVAAVLAASLVVVLVSRSMFATANYGNKYAKTFGEFTAKTTVDLLKDKKENTCYSPVSLFAALSLSAECTEGQTRKQLLDALGVDSIKKLEEMYAEMIVDLNVDEEVLMEETTSNESVKSDDEVIKPTMAPVRVSTPAKITLCNSIWIRNDHAYNGTEEIVNKCKERLNADIFFEDVIRAADVNQWVSDNTNGLIKGVLDHDLSIVTLVNTLYYKASWGDDFSEIANQDFNLEDGDTVSTEFIEANKESMNYYQGDNYTAVDVNMEEGNMLFVLPDENVKLEKLLSENTLNEILSLPSNSEMENGLVTMRIPKFTIEDSYSGALKSTIVDMGVKRFFSNNCQWSVIDIPEEMKDGLMVDIVQNTKFILNEDGVEAAAATSVNAVYLSAPVEELQLEITFDRPFLYVLMKNGVPMFIGTVYDPSEVPE